MKKLNSRAKICNCCGRTVLHVPSRELMEVYYEDVNRYKRKGPFKIKSRESSSNPS
jgi:hypothetical protein